MEDRPTAMLALSDQLALGVFEAARKLGLSIPEDLSVVGFDDVPEASRTDPPLTTVYQPHVEKGLTAGPMLVAQAGDEGPRSPGPPPSRRGGRRSTAPPGRGRERRGKPSGVGYDDHRSGAQLDLPLPPLYQPLVQNGLTAGRMLVPQLGAEEPRRPGPLPPRLVVRGSTAPPERHR